VDHVALAELGPPPQRVRITTFLTPGALATFGLPT
jgi:hypothetical protein